MLFSFLTHSRGISHDQERFQECAVHGGIRSIRLYDKTTENNCVEIAHPTGDGFVFKSDTTAEITRYTVDVANLSASLVVSQVRRIQEFFGGILKASPVTNSVYTRDSAGPIDSSALKGFSFHKQCGELTVASLSLRVGDELDGGFLAHLTVFESQISFEQLMTMNKVSLIVGAVGVTSPRYKTSTGDPSPIFVCEDTAGKFAEVIYQQFRDGRMSREVEDETIPHWIRAAVETTSRVDDIVEIVLRPATLICTRARLEEIVKCTSRCFAWQFDSRVDPIPQPPASTNHFAQISVAHQLFVLPEHYDSNVFLGVEIGTIFVRCMLPY